MCFASFSFAHPESVHFRTQVNYQVLAEMAMDDVDNDTSDDEGNKGNRVVNVGRSRGATPSHSAGCASTWGPSPSASDTVSHGAPTNSRMPTMRGISLTVHITC